MLQTSDNGKVLSKSECYDPSDRSSGRITERSDDCEAINQIQLKIMKDTEMNEFNDHVEAIDDNILDRDLHDDGSDPDQEEDHQVIRLGYGFYRIGDPLRWGSDSIKNRYVNKLKSRTSKVSNEQKSISKFPHKPSPRKQTLTDLLQIRDSVHDWAERIFFRDRTNEFIAVTIRFNPCDPITATENMKLLLHGVNSTVLKDQFHLDGKQLGCLAMVEGTTRWSRHYHLHLQNPPGMAEEVKQAIIRTWHALRGTNGTYFAYEVPFITLDADENWVRYLCKLKTKSKYLDAIDADLFNAPIHFGKLDHRTETNTRASPSLDEDRDDWTTISKMTDPRVIPVGAVEPQCCC